MKNRLTKYILSLSVLLLALFSQYHGYSGSLEGNAAKKLSGADILEYNASHVSLATVTIVKENHETFLPSDTDNEEEEVTSHAKKLVKTAALPSYYFQRLLPATIGDSDNKSSQHCGQSTPYSPYRPYIRFRVIRI